MNKRFVYFFFRPLPRPKKSSDDLAEDSDEDDAAYQLAMVTLELDSQQKAARETISRLEKQVRETAESREQAIDCAQEIELRVAEREVELANVKLELDGARHLIAEARAKELAAVEEYRNISQLREEESRRQKEELAVAENGMKNLRAREAELSARFSLVEELKDEMQQKYFAAETKLCELQEVELASLAKQVREAASRYAPFCPEGGAVDENLPPGWFRTMRKVL